MTPEISIISPVYHAETIVDELVKQVCTEVSKITDNFEIVLVEDGSSDASWQKISENASRDARVKGIKFSRNFGQHPAITAGLKYAKGDYVVVMDCDLQDDPRYISEMLDEAKKGYDIVYTKKTAREHSTFKNFTASIYNKILNSLSEDSSLYGDGAVGAFSLLSRKVVDAFCSVNDYHRHYLNILRWLGFKSTSITIEHKERFSGTSTYTFVKLLRHALDGITSQSTKLLRIAIGVGLTFCGVSFLAALSLIVLYFIQGFKEGWASIFVLMLLSTGLILFFMGILGIYLGKTFEQTKDKPLFLVETELNLD